MTYKKTSLYWRLEKLQTVANQTVIKHFESNKALDKFMKSQKLETDIEVKNVTRILEKVLKQPSLLQLVVLSMSQQEISFDPK
jgi:hypothetical protein